MKVEDIVRENDDLSLKAYESAKKISEKFDINVITCQAYLSAKRRGYSSHFKYRKYLEFKRNGFLFKPVKEEIRQDEFERSISYMSGQELDDLCFLDKEELKRTVREFVDELPEKLKKIIIGRYFSNYTLEQMTSVIGSKCYQRVQQLESEALTSLKIKIKSLDLVV